MSSVTKFSIFRKLANARLYCSSKVPVNKLENVNTSHLQHENGVVYDKKPLKIHLDSEKKYSWCLCGKSKGQPFCDGTHNNVHMKIKPRPVKFQVEATGDYYLCNCKQTKNRPFCDGTHKSLP